MPLTAAAGDLLGQVAERIELVPVLRGEFEQEREIKGFVRSLRSSGRFVAVRGRGLLWITEAPFPSELLVSERGLRERIDGETQWLLDAASEPAMRELQRVFAALLLGDLAALRDHFTASGALDDARWSLHLEARAGLAERVAWIEMSGGAWVDSLTIQETQGDRLHIRLRAQSSPPTLSEEEAARLD